MLRTHDPVARFEERIIEDENTALRKDGKRMCRICEYERRAKYRRRSLEKQVR
jgi:hypothetical protein